MQGTEGTSSESTLVYNFSNLDAKPKISRRWHLKSLSIVKSLFFFSLERQWEVEPVSSVLFTLQGTMAG